MGRPNKRNHLVPKSYLRAWATPQTDKGKLWVMDRDLRIYPGTPNGTLHDADFYQVRTEGGGTLSIENKYLSGIEGLYATLYRDKLSQLKPLEEEDKAVLALFVASMLARAPSLRDAQADFFKRITETMDAMNALLSEQKQAMAGLHVPANPEDVIPGDAVMRMAEDVPSLHSAGIPGLVSSIFGLIFEMKCGLIISADPENRFITADSPCVMVNPEMETRFGRDALIAQPGLAQEDIELSLPLSPRMAVLFGWKLEQDLQYVPFGPDKPELLQTINGRTSRYAKKLVASQKTQLEAIQTKAQRDPGNVATSK